MSTPAALAHLEDIIDASGVAPRIEARLPIGVRHRQLRVRTLLAGMLLTQADHRPAHLTRVRDALIALPDADQVRLGVTEDWKTGPHQLTYRQTERTFGLVTGALAKDHPDGAPSEILAAICDDLLEASIPGEYKQASSGAGGGLDRRGDLLPPAAARHQRLRRPRSLLGAPLRRRPRPGQRAVLRLLRLRRHHDARGARPAGPRAGPPDDHVLLPRRPGPRPGPGADPMPATASRSATSWPTPATPTATPKPGPSRSARPGRSSSRTCTPPTAAPAAPTKAPSSPTGTCTARPRPRPLLELGPLARDATPDQTAAHDTQTAELARLQARAGSPATTPTATTGSCAPPSWARSAARCARPR